MLGTRSESAPPSLDDGNRGDAGLPKRARPHLPEAAWIPPVLLFGLLAALTLVVFRRELFEHWSFPWDFTGTYTATPAFVADTIGRFHPMAWSPFVASGFPVAVNPQAGLYFPVWWVFGALHIPLVLSAVTDVQVAHVLFGSVGVVLLARARRLPWGWVGVSAVAYLFFGGYYGQAEHADYVRGFAYLPWLLWSVTPPVEGRAWYRLFALPPIMWLVATGAYPGQLVSLTIVAVAYLLVALYQLEPAERRRHRLLLVLAWATSAGACLAVLLPYLLADHNHQLVRTVAPSVAVRSAGALAPIDLLGSYLSTFAWHADGTITEWAVAVPILVGLGFLTVASLRRQLPVLVSGALALALAMTPKITLIGKAMVALGPFSTSRFPAADYKAAVALAVILLSAEGWYRLPRRHFDRRVVGGAAVAALLVLGALLVSSPYAQPTRAIWLLVGVLVAAVALSIIRPRPALLAVLVIALIAVDGFREINDYHAMGVTSSWNAPPIDVAVAQERDHFIRTLPTRVWLTFPSRPRREPPSPAAYPNAGGWDAIAYEVTDYGGTLERSLYEAEQDPALLSLLVQPWQAFVFPCPGGRCPTSGAKLPPPGQWRGNGAVRTRLYAAGRIVYEVHLARPSLVVENELAIAGWQSSDKRAQIISTSLPLRTWRLAAGNYTFTASYHQPGRLAQELLTVLALLGWAACGWAVLRLGRDRGAQPERPTSARNSSYSRM